METLLTSEAFIKTATNISDNTSDKFILSAIRESQSIDLQQVIGTKMLKKLQSLVESGDIESEDNAIYKELLDNCQYFLAYSAIEKICLTSSSKISNTGVFSTNDENVQAFSLNDVFRIKDEYTHKADHYKYLLQLWLTENHSSLPELTKSKVSEINSNLYSAASSGMFLGGNRGKGCTYNKTHIGYDKK